MMPGGGRATSYVTLLRYSSQLRQLQALQLFAVAVVLLDALEAVVIIFAWLLLGDSAAFIPHNGT